MSQDGVAAPAVVIAGSTIPLPSIAWPVCRWASHRIYHPLSGRSLAAMGDALGIAKPFQLDAPQHIARCEACGLEFSDPMSNPGKAFYTWLTSEQFEYPKGRWEWVEAVSMLEKLAADRPVVVLDAGSGEGRFLEAINKIPGLTSYGIDQNPDVVAASQLRGLNVRQGDLSIIGLDDLGVDVITFWHVVEHVADPLEMLERARDCLHGGGTIMFSVPITPMSYEHAWPDPFNMPPHHLTRWSIRSLEALARRLGMQFSMTLPTAASIHSRTLRSLVLRTSGSSGPSSPLVKAVRVLRYVLRNPHRLVQEIRQQREREVHDGKPLPDVVLVSLRKRG